MGVFIPEGRAGPLYSSTALASVDVPSSREARPVTPATVRRAGL